MGGFLVRNFSRVLADQMFQKSPSTLLEIGAPGGHPTLPGQREGTMLLCCRLPTGQHWQCPCENLLLRCAAQMINRVRPRDAAISFIRSLSAGL